MNESSSRDDANTAIHLVDNKGNEAYYQCIGCQQSRTYMTEPTQQHTHISHIDCKNQLDTSQH
jgi:hypothetical protein